MERRNVMGIERRASRGLLSGMAFLLVTILLAAAPAAATPANFDPVFGFEAAGLEALPVGMMDGDDNFLTAGEGGGMSALDVELSGSTDLCIFTASSPSCQGDTAGITGAYSAFVTITVSAINTSEISGPFTLFLSGLAAGSYGVDEVTIELNPTVPDGLDTSGIPGFGFELMGHIVDESFAPAPAYHYVGWRAQLGDTISFRYDVSTAPGSRGAPQLMANAIGRAIVPVPEPGTAVLMGLGLVALGVRGRRIAPELD
jgi:hypothetical protein